MNATTSAVAELATTLTAQFPPGFILSCLNVIISNRPETAHPILFAFKNEMAADHGLAQLYQTLESGDFSTLPTPEALKFDLQNICKVDLFSDKEFIHDALRRLSDHLPYLLAEPLGPHVDVVNLAECCHVLLKALGQIDHDHVVTAGQLKLMELIQINRLFTRATTGFELIEHLVRTRNFLTFKRDELAHAMTAVREWGRIALEELSPELRNNLEVVMLAVMRGGNALEFASDTLKNNRDVVLTALQTYAYALEFASLELRGDFDLVTVAVQQNGLSLRHATEAMQDNETVVIAAIQENGDALEFASVGLRNTRHVVLVAVRNWGHALAFASLGLQDDAELVMTAVQSWGRALEFASDAIKDNLRIATAAVLESAFALESVSTALQNNRPLVLSAVLKDGRALQFASVRLRNNREIVLTAVRQDGYALQFVGHNLQNDIEVVLAAVHQDPGALHFVRTETRNIPQITSAFFNARYRANPRDADALFGNSANVLRLIYERHALR